jgi:hypothetical protein
MIEKFRELRIFVYDWEYINLEKDSFKWYKLKI